MESNLEIWLIYGIPNHSDHLPLFSNSRAEFPLVDFMNFIGNFQKIQDRYGVGGSYIHLLVPNQIYREIIKQSTCITNWRTAEQEYYNWGFIEEASKRLVRRDMWRGLTLAPRCSSWETRGISQLQKDLWGFMRSQPHTETFRALELRRGASGSENQQGFCPLGRGRSLLTSQMFF